MYHYKEKNHFFPDYIFGKYSITHSTFT